MDNVLFTAHVSNLCQNKEKWRPGPAFFDCPGEMQEEIKRAIENSPARKAPGIDEMKAEMLKIDK